MGWVNIQSAIRARFHPTPGDPPTWKDQRMNVVALDYSEFKLAVKGRNLYRLPHDRKPYPSRGGWSF